MNITIICVGKLKETYWKDAQQEYLKRLKRFAKIHLIEVMDESSSITNSDADKTSLIVKEGQRILNKIPANAYVIVMDVNGKKMSSEQFAKQMSDIGIYHASHICFVVGGSLGVSSEVKKISHLKLSFSEMTFPHQLFRVILLEQIYRCFKINHNEAYHK